MRFSVQGSTPCRSLGCIGLDRSTKPMLPLVAVNTTAGTAAEMTRFTIITDTDRHVKMAIIDRLVEGGMHWLRHI